MFGMAVALLKLSPYLHHKITDMKNLTLIMLALCTIIFVNCKTKSKATTSASGEKTAADTNQGTKVKCRVAVSFISFASGIDGAKYEAVKSYIEKHPKKPSYEEIPMGREGERDFCLSLKEMNSSEQTEFIKDLKKLAEGSDRVKVMEDAERTKWK